VKPRPPGLSGGCGAHPRTDELYGAISFVDCHNGLTRDFRTARARGRVHHRQRALDEFAAQREIDET
jgi:hypothetical protein